MKKILTIWIVYEALAIAYNRSQQKTADANNQKLVAEANKKQNVSANGELLPNNVFQNPNYIQAKQLPSFLQALVFFKL